MGQLDLNFLVSVFVAMCDKGVFASDLKAKLRNKILEDISANYHRINPLPWSLYPRPFCVRFILSFNLKYE